MAGIKHLKQIHDKKGDDFLNNLLNNFVIINENINGTFFGLTKDKKTDRFRYFKKSGEITYVDRMLMKYYNPAIAYFETISEDKRQRIPSNFYFGFEFVTKRDAESSNFTKLPKNNLILSYIHRLDDNGTPIETLQTKDDLDKWAFYLGVEAPPIIFEGLLNDEQKTSILDFVYSPSSKLLDKFKTTSFTKYIISILNPNATETRLKKGKGDIDTIIFRFYDENDENSKANAFLAKLVDPIFQNKSKENKESDVKKSNDYIWLIVIDLMNKIELYSEEDLRKRCENAGDEDYNNRYICLINSIFKDFISDYSNKYDGLQLDIPEYLSRPEFEIDYKLINNKEVVNLIKNNETYKEIYRILTNFFRKPRKKTTSGFFTPELLTQLNIQIKKIKRVVMGDVLYEGLFPSFEEFTGESIFVGEHENIKKRSITTEKVNILIGNFQPVHNGHLKAANKLKEKNGLKCVFIAIHKDNKKYPFSEKSTKIFLEKAQQENSDIIRDVIVSKLDSIKGILSDLKPQFDPILWGSSAAKIKDYALQFDYVRAKDIPIRVSDELKLVEIPSYQKSSDLISMIKDGNYNEFKELVPKSISSEFFNLQKELS